MKKTDPRAKLIWGLAGFILIMTSAGLASQLLFLTVIIGFSAWNNIPFPGLFKPVKYLFIFLPVIFGVHVIFTSKLLPVMFSGEFHWHQFAGPLMFTARIAAFFLLNSFLFQWIGATEFQDSMYLLIRPFRKIGVPVEEVFQVVFIAIRFFPILTDEFRRIDRSWRNYVKTEADTLKTRLMRARQTLIPLMIFSFRKADRLAESMAVRGFDPQAERSYYTELSFSLKDGLISLGGLGVIIMTILNHSGMAVL